MRKRIEIGALLLLCGILSGGRAGAQVIDKTVAVVQDEAIFLADLEREVLRIKFMQGLKDLSPGDEEALRAEILQQLIAEKLILAKAKELQLTVDPSDVENAVDQQIEDLERRTGGRAGLERELAREGMSLNELRLTYRDQIHNYLLKDRLMASQLRQRIRITDDDVREYYLENRDKIPNRPESLELAQILISIEASDAISRDVLRRVEQVKSEATAGVDFGELAKRYSEGPSAERGGDLGWFRYGDFNSPAFEDAANELGIGEISDPVRSQFGYHLIQLLERDGDRLHVRHILFRVEAGTADESKAAARADSVRAMALAGEPFEELAKKYSDDAGTRDEGGYLGTFAVDEIKENYAGVLEDVEPGGISRTFKDEEGFRVFKLLSRQDPRPYVFSEISEDLKKLLFEERRRDETEKYVEELRNEFSVVVWN